MRKNMNADIRKPEILEHYYQTIAEIGFEKASIGKIAERMGIHPSLIIHYFRTKERMTIELGEMIAKKYRAEHLWTEFRKLTEPAERFDCFMDLLFSDELAQTIDDSVYFTFYYLSFRNAEIRASFRGMFRQFRGFVLKQLEEFRNDGVIGADDLEEAADLLMVLVEGTDFHANFVSENPGTRGFAGAGRALACRVLKVSE